MSKRVIAHLSDMHLSQFGERVTATALLRGELPRSGLVSRVEWEDFEAVDGWRIQRWSKLRRFADLLRGSSLGLRLVDPSGVRHDRYIVAPGRAQGRRVDEAVERMRTLARVRSQAALSSLCSNRLSSEERNQLLSLDPGNTNLRFLESVEAVQALGPDVVALTGDLTDDGHGYELVVHALRDYVQAGRLFAVAGNHDLSAVPPGTHHNMSLHDKDHRWRAFLSAAHHEPETNGAMATVIDGIFFLGLNSSVNPSRIAFSGRGKVGRRQLATAAHFISRADTSYPRICCVHHHVAHLRLGPIARADPGQFAMKLRDARHVVHLLGTNRFLAVLNGHRHHGYHVQEAELPHVVSSPSTTLGCRASGARYFWRLTLEDSALRVERQYFGGHPAQGA